MLYNFVIGIQVVSIVLIVIVLFYLFRRKSGELLHITIFLCAALLINQTGYLFEMTSRSIDAAMNAIRFAYLGKMVALLFIFMYQMTFCGIRMSRKVTYPLSSVHFLIVAAVWTNDFHHLYYSTVDYTEEGLFPHVVLGHGPLYGLFIVFTLAYLIVMLGVCGFRMVQYKDRVIRHKLHLVFFNPLISIVALSLWASGCSGGYDVTAAGYLFQTILMTYALVKYDIVSPLDSAREDLVENHMEPIFILNDSGDIIYGNKGFKEMMQSLHDNTPKEEILRIQNAYNRSVNYELNGHIYQVKKSCISPKESYLCHIFILYDITTIYNTQINLLQAREEAEFANEAKSRFLANMSHEIRTPINAVLGMNTMILRKSTDDEILKYASDIQDAGKNLLEIINDILDFSKIESGKMEIASDKYVFLDVVKDLYNMINTKAREKKLNFKMDIDDTIPSVLLGDDVRVRQVLINLLTNAVKYTVTGTVTFIVRKNNFVELRNDECSLHFEVRDTGIGIKEEDISKLTEKFVRIEESRNRNIEGTGLGINIVSSLLKMMNSELSVESVYGEGSTFYFDLVQPVIDSTPIGDVEKKIKTFNKEERKYETKVYIPDARLLVVDDNNLNLSVFTRLVSDMKCQVDVADSGFKCLELVEKNKYDLIFMDHMMPKMDGTETLHRMHNMGDYINSDTPVVILTANAIRGAKEQYLSEGFVDYLSKPIDVAKLEAIIERYVLNNGKELAEQEKDTSEEIIAVDTLEEKAELEELPFIDGVDWEHAISKLKDEGLLRESVRNYFGMAATDLNTLKAMYEKLREDVSQEITVESFSDFRIKIHSMKSNVATIGADHLAGLAKYLEYAARDCNLETINNLLPLFETEWNRLKTEINDAFQYSKDNDAQNEQLPAIDTDELLLFLDSLNESMEEADLDRADEIVDVMSEYSYDEEQEVLLMGIKNSVLNIDVTGCSEIIEKWKKFVGK